MESTKRKPKSAITERRRNLTAFMKAISAQDFETVESLLKEKFPVNKSFHNAGIKWTPLTYAIEKKCNIQLLDVILKAGASIHTPCVLETVMYSPLHLAIEHGSPDLAQHLLQSGANPNQITGVVREAEEEGGNIEYYFNFTVLHWCIEKKDVAMVTMLLEHGADVHRINDDGNTPLKFAINDIDTLTFEQELIIKNLIRYGALSFNDNENADQKRKFSLIRDVVYGFIENESPSLVKFILHAGFDIRNDIHGINLDHENNRTHSRHWSFAVIYEWLHKPLDLKVLCRCVIRQTIGHKIKPSVLNELTLPAQLIQYLNLEHGIS